MKRVSLVVFLLFAYLCGASGAETNHYERLQSLTNWNEIGDYLRALPEDEVWVLANQMLDNQGNWQSYPSGILLALYYGDNWERRTPTIDKVLCIIQDARFLPELRGSLAASGFEISRAWEFEDRIRYFKFISDFFCKDDIPIAEKSLIAEYSYNAFKRCLSEVVLLSVPNTKKSALLNDCHTCARIMMSALSALVERNQNDGNNAALRKALEAYASTYEHDSYTESPQLTETLYEAAKIRLMLQQNRE